MSWKRHKQYRLPFYDYSSAGAYFITICTKDRQRHFGEIVTGEMRLSAIGRFVEENILGLEGRLTPLQIDESVIMPDHLHLILTITDTSRNVPVENAPRGAFLRVGLRPLVPKSIEAFVNHFKGAVTRWCREHDLREFGWQARFNDRVIRDHAEYLNIKRYIQSNIDNWIG